MFRLLILAGVIYLFWRLTRSDRPKLKAGPALGKPDGGRLEAAYALLGLAQDASWRQIKRAYQKRVAEYHPDRVATLGADLQVLAEQRTKEINEAYQTLRAAKAPPS